MNPGLPQAAARMRVATITDQFTHNSFRQEFDAIPIEPSNWAELFERHAPQALFCESAWTGLDLTRKPWRGGIHSYGHPARRQALKNILLHCRARGIPTIFWNKEDPAFYRDPKTDFSQTAAVFDFLFTSAEECVDRYQQDYGRRALVLPFAANQHMFNPVETAHRSSSLVFAGSWYPQFPQRSREMDSILDQFIQDGSGIEIRTRFHGPDEPLNQWPVKYRPYLRPGVPHDLMPAVYKSSRFGLNINTTTDSRTMFARRVFELMACNTLVVSNYSIGMKVFFGDLAVYADREPDRLRALRDDEIDALRQAALLRVLRDHTYAHRWRRILSALGMPMPSERPSIAWICAVQTVDAGREAIARFKAGPGPDFPRAGDAGPPSDWLAGIVLLPQTPLSAQDLQDLARSSADGRIVICRGECLAASLDHLGARFFLRSSSAELPSAQWIREAGLHLSYMRAHALTPACGARYRLTRWLRGQPVLGERALLGMLTTLEGPPAQLVYPV
jgi:hypothetical protein